MQQWSGPFPVEVISEMLGIPKGDRQQIRHWLDIILHREEGSIHPSPEAEARAGRYIALMLAAVLLFLGLAAWVLRAAFTR